MSRLDLLVAALRRIEAHYLRMKAGHSPHEAWKERLATLGQWVVVSSLAGERYPEAIEGLAEDVDADGALLVRASGGQLQRVVAGDVTLRR